VVNRSFRQSIEEAKKERGSNIVLALDYTNQDPRELFLESEETLKAVSPYICAVKFNRQLVLPLGLYSGVKKLVDFTRTLRLPSIMDCKINDIGNTNHEIANHYYKAGFDAVTANPFVGWEGGLDAVFHLAEELDKGVILLVYMSHRGAAEGYGQRVMDPRTDRERLQYQVFAEDALKWGADGVVVGATYPEIVLEVNEIVKGKVPIYSPGIGVQGGKIESALKRGTEYLIIGRSILHSKDPVKSVKAFKGIADRCLEK
jgi:orotidine-5'-phosphate decarboxylase